MSHNYTSLKLKYKQQQEIDFPSLIKNKSNGDGFGHMIEEEESNEVEDMIKAIEKESGTAITTDEINPDEFDYEAEESTEVKATEEVKGKESYTDMNTLKINPDDFVYDAENDTVVPKNPKAFSDLVEQHPMVNKLKRDTKRNEKVEKLKGKVLDTLKVKERKDRSLSCESVKSGISDWGDTDSMSERGSTRPRSDDSDTENPNPKKSSRKSRPAIKPPRIVMSK